MKKMSVILLTIFCATALVAWANQNPRIGVVFSAATQWGILQDGQIRLGDTHDFGSIALGKPASITFVVTNTGDAPLVITQVQASCGCTIAAWTKEPIAPGATGKVEATYNAAGLGAFHKSVTVSTNTSEGVQMLYFKGEVVNP